jgi:L-fucose isomerase-like protein
MLSTIAEGTPALFGDITYIGKTYLIISNCGASSVYYACNSFNTGEMLKNITLEANCEGVSGGAVGYTCPPGRMTLARLVRVKGKYFMHVGRANAIEITDSIKSKFHYGRTWPHTALQMNIDPQLLAKALGANHLSAIPGDYIEEIQHFCKLAGIEIFRIDQNNGLERWLERVQLME